MAHSSPDPRPASRPSKDFARYHEIIESRHQPGRYLNKIDIRGSESEDFLNETSPLLSPEQAEDRQFRRGEIRTPSGQLECNEGDEEQSKSVWYLFLLTLSIGG